jgi:hypothetical protein
MRILLAMVLAGTTMSVGCTTLCGSGCASGKCSAQSNAMSAPTSTVAAKPKMNPSNPAGASPVTAGLPQKPATTKSMVPAKGSAVVPVENKVSTMKPSQPVMPADHDAMMPDGEPSASLVPPPPSAAQLSEEGSHLPSPKQIAKKSSEFASMPRVPARDDDWNTSPSDDSKEDAPAKPTEWSSRHNPRSPLGN